MEDEVLNQEEVVEEKYYMLGIEVSYEEMDRLSCLQAEGKELKIIDGKVVAVDYEMTEEEKLKNQISELITLLQSTDYIALKIAEAETEEERQALREEYAEQLSNRKKWREQINSLENQLKS